ncbi:DUF1624 domain-containing protein [Flaviaesturariibacter amylovorans]|uniref:DUF1624 domain-containing protein n=1 Tax=Flaviaesturariibacter amylovorans TaxID=1084520 RepID=A0ABP8GHU3_9BACT
MNDLHSPASRIGAIDLLRGLVMVIMALDHTRDFFHADALRYDPTDLSQTNSFLFFTRWITHYCAPVFYFLAGTSAYLTGRRRSKKKLAIFLLTRGIWLMLLELTVVHVGWTFNLTLPFFALATIWALGLAMAALSLLIFLPMPVLLATGVLIVAGHNLLDGVHVPGTGAGAFIWSVLHDTRFIPEQFTFLGRPMEVAYPVLPWIGVMALGYCFGTFYRNEVPAATRRKATLLAGLAALALFVVLRTLNVYGDPQPWSPQTTTVFTLLSFLNTTKYPPSLLFLLMTLGPALLLLRLVDTASGRVARAAITIGRVPMFFYLLHIYLIHLLALFVAVLTGYHWSDMVSQVPFTPAPRNWGQPLAVVYLVWMLVVALLYPLCRWYERYKSSHREQWWLSYV